MNPEFVVVHNTANDASAENEIAYMKRNNNTVSFHYAVDDIEAVQGIEENRNSWNAGDGRNGQGNRKGIAIEICYSKSGGERFDQAEKNAVELIVSILQRYGWGIEQVKKHQDFANKYCPHRTLDLGWNRFLDMVRAKLNDNEETVEEVVEQQPEETHENENIDIFHDGKINCIFDIQEYLNNHYGFNLTLDNDYGVDTHEKMIKALQIELNNQFNKGLKVDGVFGVKTKEACVSVKQGAKGRITYLIQMMLFIKGYSLGIDGKYGTETKRVVGEFQKANGLSATGSMNKDTFEKLFK